MTERIPRVGAAGYGAMLGFCNTLFIAIGVGVRSNFGFGLAFVVFMFGIVPGLITGAALGAMAASMAERAVWLRRLAIALERNTRALSPVPVATLNP